MEMAKTKDEILELLINSELDFESVENQALNDYLPKIFHSYPPHRRSLHCEKIML